MRVTRLVTARYLALLPPGDDGCRASCRVTLSGTGRDGRLLFAASTVPVHGRIVALKVTRCTRRPG